MGLAPARSRKVGQVSNPAIFAHAVALIRNGRLEQAVNLLQTAVPGLPPEHHRKAHSYAGLAYYSSERWADALGYFRMAAKGSPVPEDHFNQAMALVNVGDIEGAHATWQKEGADFIETRRSGYGER